MYAAIVVIRSDGVEDRWALRQPPPSPDVQVLTFSDEHLKLMRQERGDDWLGDEPATLIPTSTVEDGIVDYHVDPSGSLLIYQAPRGPADYVLELARYAPGAWLRAQRVRPRMRTNLAYSEAQQQAHEAAARARQTREE